MRNHRTTSSLERPTSGARTSTLQRLRAGQRLWRGSRGACLYRLVDGWAARVRLLSHERRAPILSFYLPGEVIGVAANVPEEVRMLTAGATEWLCDDPQTEGAHRQPLLWLDYLSAEQRLLSIRVASLSEGTAEERVALLLADFHDRSRTSAQAEELIEFALPITQMQIAAHVGVTSVHVNRVLRRFREQGIAHVSNGRARLIDLPKLAQIAGVFRSPSISHTSQLEITVGKSAWRSLPIIAPIKSGGRP